MQHMKELFLKNGSLVLELADGKRVFLIGSRHLPGCNGLLIAMEGGGCYLYDFQQPLTWMRLTTFGFRIDAAKAIEVWVNNLLEQIGIDVPVVAKAQVENKGDSP